LASEITVYIVGAKITGLLSTMADRSERIRPD
jgi:hypothetical protein